MRFQLFIARARGNREQLRFVGGLLGHNPIGEQRDNPIGRGRTKDNVGRHLEDAIEIESGAERLAHFVNLAEDVCLSLQRFENFISAWRRSAAYARIRLAQNGREHIFRGHQ